MPDQEPWSLTVDFSGVTDGAAGSLGETPFKCQIKAIGPNGQVRQRLLLTAAAFHVMLRDADPGILMELAMIRPGHEIQFHNPGDA